MGAAKTGSGKTLAFLVPALEKLYRLGWSSMDGKFLGNSRTVTAMLCSSGDSWGKQQLRAVLTFEQVLAPDFC